MLPERQAGYLDLVFSATALAREGAVVDLLSKSSQFTTDLGSRLRQRIYERVVPDLAVGVAEALDRRSHRGPAGDLQYSYRLSLRILFRLLFQAYAEDRGLLPYGRNNHFDRPLVEEACNRPRERSRTELRRWSHDVVVRPSDDLERD